MKRIIQNGEVDWSDEGLGADQIKSSIDIAIFLKNLSERHRSVLQLKEYGYQNEEIAEKLGINEKTVRRDLNEIKKRLVQR